LQAAQNGFPSDIIRQLGGLNIAAQVHDAIIVHQIIEAAASGELVRRMELRVAAQMSQVRYCPGNRFPQKYDRPHVCRKEIKYAAGKMPLEQSVLLDFPDTESKKFEPVIRRHYLRNRILITEEDAQRHARSLRDVHKKDSGAPRRPNDRGRHRFINVIAGRSGRRDASGDL
jgi:hypothetical protein